MDNTKNIEDAWISFPDGSFLAYPLWNFFPPRKSKTRQLKIPQGVSPKSFDQVPSGLMSD